MRRIGLLLIILAGVISACDTGKNDTADQVAKDELEDLRGDTVNIDYAQRLEELNERIKDDKNNPNLWHERAYVHFHEGNMEDAITDVKTAIELAPDVGAFYFTKGMFFHAELKLEEARTAFKQALERDPDIKEANLFLAKINLALRNYEDAYDQVNAALKTDEFYPEAYFIKGMIHEDRGDSVKAANTYKTAIEQNPEYYDAFIQLALLHSSWGDGVAVDYFQSALELRPNSSEALYGLGMFYQEAGNFDGAEAAYQRIIAVDSNFALAYYNIGYLYLEFSDDMDKSINYFVEAVKKNPGSYLKHAYFNLGLAHERKGDNERAAEFYQLALDVDPQYTEAAKGKGRVLR